MEGGKATKLALGWIRNSNGWCGRHHPKVDLNFEFVNNSMIIMSILLNIVFYVHS